METTALEFPVTVHQNTDNDSILNNIIDLVPFEMHVPGYRFCGPGTHLEERLKRGETGINPLDEACRQHDIAYADKKSKKGVADRVLAEKAFSRLLAEDASNNEKSVAMLTACCMLSKIAFEKFFTRVKNALKCDKKKKKKVCGKTRVENDNLKKKLKVKKANLSKKKKADSKKKKESATIGEKKK